MKYFNHKIIGIAMMCATVMACTDKYDYNLQVEKPEEVANSEYLASFDLLKSYITREFSVQVYGKLVFNRLFKERHCLQHHT